MFDGKQCYVKKKKKLIVNSSCKSMNGCTGNSKYGQDGNLYSEYIYWLAKSSFGGGGGVVL